METRTARLSVGIPGELPEPGAVIIKSLCRLNGSSASD